MSIFTRLRHLLGGQKELSPEDLAREEELKKQLRERCARFRRLLSSNKNALEIMSEVEEALAGSRPFGMSYVRGAGTRAATAVYQMVRELNALSDNQYESLQTAFNDVSGRITDVLERKSLVTDGRSRFQQSRDKRHVSSLYEGRMRGPAREEQSQEQARACRSGSAARRNRSQLNTGRVSRMSGTGDRDLRSTEGPGKEEGRRRRVHSPAGPPERSVARDATCQKRTAGGPAVP